MRLALLAIGLLASGLVAAGLLGVGAWPWPVRVLYAACVLVGAVGLLLWRGEEE